MKENVFYDRVSSWIRTYRNPDALGWLKRFVDNSSEPADVKQLLHKEIDYREMRLRETPTFKETTEGKFLVNDKGEIWIYTSRFSAVCKISELLLKGYEVELAEENKLYKIKTT